MSPKQFWSDDERATVGRKRAQSPAVEYVEPDTTDKCETPEQVAEMRSNREPGDRFKRLEDRMDRVEPAVARMDGKLDAMLDYAARADAERERRAKQDADALAARRKFIIAIVTILAGIATAWVSSR